jgi:ribosome biogenesis protein SSF1/2
VRAAQRKPYDSAAAYRVPPLAVLHSFGGREAPPTTKLLRVTLQNMFPPIDVATAKLADCRRVVLFRLDAETGVVRGAWRVAAALVPLLRLRRPRVLPLLTRR